MLTFKSFLGCTSQNSRNIFAFEEVEVWSSLTWSNEGPSTDSWDTAAHVYSSDLCDCCTVRLLPSFSRTVRGTGLPSCGDLSSLAWILDQWGRLNGHRGLLQTQSLQGLSLRGGRGRHLLAPNGKILNLVLGEEKVQCFAVTSICPEIIHIFFYNWYIYVSSIKFI